MRSASPHTEPVGALGIQDVIDPAEVGIGPVGISHPRPIDEEADRVIGLLAGGLCDRRGKAVGRSRRLLPEHPVRLIKRARKLSAVTNAGPAPSARAMPTAQASIAAQSQKSFVGLRIATGRRGRSCERAPTAARQSRQTVESGSHAARKDTGVARADRFSELAELARRAGLPVAPLVLGELTTLRSDQARCCTARPGRSASSIW